MRDVVKTNVKRQQSSKRQHRRTRHHASDILLVVLLVIGVAVSLSVTLFFNVTTVDIINETQYDDYEIVALTGIRSGDNLVRMETAAMRQKILDNYVYAEDVQIRKKFPTTLEITVTNSVPIANVKYQNGYLLVSGSGKILETVENPQENLLIIEGFDPKTDVPGKMLESNTEDKNNVLDTLTRAVAENSEAQIHSLDMSDCYEITVNFGARFVFSMGNSNDASYKLRLAAKTISMIEADETESGKKKSYHMTMVGNNQISVISDDSARVNEPKPTNDTAETPINENTEE